MPIFDLMEDAATAEISRAQLWQWIHHKVCLKDGRVVDASLCLKTIEEEMEKMRCLVGDQQFQVGRYNEAAGLLLEMIRSPRFIEFLLYLLISGWSDASEWWENAGFSSQ